MPQPSRVTKKTASAPKAAPGLTRNDWNVLEKQAKDRGTNVISYSDIQKYRSSKNGMIKSKPNVAGAKIKIR